VILELWWRKLPDSERLENIGLESGRGGRKLVRLLVGISMPIFDKSLIRTQ